MYMYRKSNYVDILVIGIIVFTVAIMGLKDFHLKLLGFPQKES